MSHELKGFLWKVAADFTSMSLAAVVGVLLIRFLILPRLNRPI